MPPEPQQTNELLKDFEEFINSDRLLHLHPVERSALAHLQLTRTQPFQDGNERVSRLMMNLMLIRSGFPPVTIRKGEREEYLGALREAFEGDFRPFVRFVAKGVGRTLDECLSVALLHKRQAEFVEKFEKLMRLIS